MKKLLLLLTVIALCGCGKHEETPNYLVGNTFVCADVFSAPFREMSFVGNNTMFVYTGFSSRCDTVQYSITETSDTSQVFCFENRYFIPPYFQGTLYFDGAMKDVIRLRNEFPEDSVDRYASYLYTKQK
jgi:hypothetical protein